MHTSRENAWKHNRYTYKRCSTFRYIDCSIFRYIEYSIFRYIASSITRYIECSILRGIEAFDKTSNIQHYFPINKIRWLHCQHLYHSKCIPCNTDVARRVGRGTQSVCTRHVFIASVGDLRFFCVFSGGCLKSDGVFCARVYRGRGVNRI